MSEESIVPFKSGPLRTMRSGKIRIELDIEPEYAQLAFAMFGQPGATGAMVRLTETAAKALQNGQAPAAFEDPAPYGAEAQKLFVSNFFRSPKVWEAIGSDGEFLEWVKSQRCAKTGEVGHESNPVVAAHVRRVANGSGIAEKPPYSAIPLLNELHQLQHLQGESAVAPKEWWDKMRIKYVAKWAAAKLKEELGYQHWSQVPVTTLYTWAEISDVLRFLPEPYRSAK